MLSSIKVLHPLIGPAHATSRLKPRVGRCPRSLATRVQEKTTSLKCLVDKIKLLSESRSAEVAWISSSSADPLKVSQGDLDSTATEPTCYWEKFRNRTWSTRSRF